MPSTRDQLRSEIWRKHSHHPHHYGYGTRLAFFRRWQEKSDWVDARVNELLVGRIVASQRRRRRPRT
jgi:hypothetical protein